MVLNYLKIRILLVLKEGKTIYATELYKRICGKKASIPYKVSMNYFYGVLRQMHAEGYLNKRHGKTGRHITSLYSINKSGLSELNNYLVSIK